MDNISPEKRSWNMSRIRSKNTKPEIVVRSLIHKMGFRFRLFTNDVPGKPDIVLRRYKIAIFVHGCFWHRHIGCKYAYTPKSNTEFWQNKFNKNIDRDRTVEIQLKEAGWKQIVVWECELADPSKLAIKLKRLINDYSVDPASTEFTQNHGKKSKK